jgi:hypothetical protein
VEHESNDLCRAAAIEQWIAAIGEEEALASVNHSVAEVDQWEQAHFHEEELRNKAKGAKKKYEAALRFKFLAFRNDETPTLFTVTDGWLGRGVALRYWRCVRLDLK